jgi:hypothetical protein
MFDWNYADQKQRRTMEQRAATASAATFVSNTAVAASPTPSSLVVAVHWAADGLLVSNFACFRRNLH